MLPFFSKYVWIGIFIVCFYYGLKELKCLKEKSIYDAVGIVSCLLLGVYTIDALSFNYSKILLGKYSTGFWGIVIIVMMSSFSIARYKEFPEEKDEEVRRKKYLEFYWSTLFCIIYFAFLFYLAFVR